MALVRRVVGRAQVPGSAVVAPPAPGAVPLGPSAVPLGPGAVPAQGEGAYPHPAYPAPYVAPPAVPGHEMAAAVASPAPRGLAVLAAFGLTGLGALGAWDINQFMQPTVFQVGSQTSAFAALFVFAAAVERLLEPVSRWLPGRTAQQRYEQAMADMDNGVPGAIQAAAHFKAAADQARATRGVVMWGIATLVATLLSAGAGFYLLRMISADPGWHGIATWTDALVTGLIVGSGTKPVHDVLNRIQNPSPSS